MLTWRLKAVYEAPGVSCPTMVYLDPKFMRQQKLVIT